MAERDRQRQRERSPDIESDVDVDVGDDVDIGVADDLLEEPSRPESSGGVRTRVRETARTVATGRSLAAALVLVAAGAFLVGELLPLGVVGTLLGVALGGSLYGTLSDTRHYTETSLAGALAGGVSVLLGNLALSLIGVGVPLVVVGAVGGGLAGLVGHYLGRDLRDGLTREV
jgi:hypothetical protein